MLKQDVEAGFVKQDVEAGLVKQDVGAGFIKQDVKARPKVILFLRSCLMLYALEFFFYAKTE